MSSISILGGFGAMDMDASITALRRFLAWRLSTVRNFDPDIVRRREAALGGARRGIVGGCPQPVGHRRCGFRPEGFPPQPRALSRLRQRARPGLLPRFPA